MHAKHIRRLVQLLMSLQCRRHGLLPLEVVAVREMRVGNQIDNPFWLRMKLDSHHFGTSELPISVSKVVVEPHE